MRANEGNRDPITRRYAGNCKHGDGRVTRAKYFNEQLESFCNDMVPLY